MTRARARAIFREECARFVAAFPRSRRIRRAYLTIVDAPCFGRGPCAERDLAECFTDTGEVRLLRRALTSESRVRGLVRHELGHICDPAIDRAGREQRADDIAERATGRRVYYDRADVQTTRRGRYPRPAHLHR